MNSSIVHTGLAVGTAGGVSDALVTLLVWVLSLAHVTVPSDVAAAFGVLFTVGLGLVIHKALGTLVSANDNGSTAKAAPPSPAQPASAELAKAA